MPGCLRHLAFACLVYMTLVLEVAAAAPRIWVATADESGPYAEAVGVLKEGLGTDYVLTVAPWRALFPARGAPPELIVTVGVGALDGVLEGLGSRGGPWARVPVLAILIPEAVFDARLAANPPGRPFSAALIDQPLGRQLALIRRVLPQFQRVAVLSGPQTRLLFPDLQREALSRQLELRQTQPIASAEDIYPALKQAIEASEVILAQPDPLIYNSASLQNILLTTYRARIPLVAFSPAYVKAGALLAVYSTPAQIARRAVEMVRQRPVGTGLPLPHKPREFEVVVNERVAASLGLWIDQPQQIVDDLRRQEGGR